MRPRVFPAEDSRLRRKVDAGESASMRPRVFPAEDENLSPAARISDARCFNEAAGIPRGRRFVGCYLYHTKMELQ